MIAEQFVDAARKAAVSQEELKHVNFQHAKFDAIVSILKEGIAFNLRGDAKVSKDEADELIALSVFKFLQQKDLNEDGLNPECPSFSCFGPQMPWMNAGFSRQASNCGNKLLNSDVAIGIISKAGCESTFAELLLENDDDQTMIIDICSSLQKWENFEKSALFVFRCLETLVKCCKSCPSEVASNMQCLLIKTLECNLIKMDVKERSSRLYAVKSLYRHAISKAVIALKEIEKIKCSKDQSALLKMSASIIKREIDSKLSGSCPDRERRKVQRELQKIVSTCTPENETQRKNELLQIVLNAGDKFDKRDEEIEKFNLVCNGFKLIDSLSLRFGLESVENDESCKEHCLLSEEDLRKVVALYESPEVAKSKDFSTIFAELEDVGHLHPLQIFQELLFGVESAAAKCVENETVCSDFNNLLCLYATLVPSFEVLTMLIRHLARVTLPGGHGLFGYDVYISNIGVEAASEVLMSCQEYYASENFKMVGDYDHNNPVFQEDLNGTLNSLAKSKDEEDIFNMLARMCLHDPNAVLEELIRIAVNSQPQSTLVLAFLSRMPALLSLKCKGGQETAIISAILKSGLQLKRQNFETMAEFVKGVTQITGVISSGCNIIISPMQILEFLVIPQLGKHVAQNVNDALPLILILHILQRIFNKDSLLLFEALDAETISVQLLKCTLSIAKIMTRIEESAQNQFEHLRKTFEERDLMHCSILGALQLLKSLHVDQASYQHISKMLLSELPNLDWKYQFYFAELLRMDHSSAISMSLPSVLKYITSAQKDLNFKYFENNHFNGPHGIWLALFELFPINQEATERFLKEHLQAAEPKIRDLLTAISIIMAESTKQMWNEVVNLISKFVKLVDSKLFNEIGLQKFMAGPEIIQQTACEISLISHAILVILKKFGKYDELIVTNALVNLHEFLVKKIKHCDKFDENYSVKCLAVVYNYTAFLNNKIPSNYDCGLKMLMLHVLELIVAKMNITENDDKEVAFWNSKLSGLKKSLI